MNGSGIVTRTDRLIRASAQRGEEWEDSLSTIKAEKAVLCQGSGRHGDAEVEGRGREATLTTIT
ncbi:hypothetical protein E2C01_026969 [Portunus trituberculatus]|uniref:Uncharacterized protein n=1 Tax=Portunus trituberculatus TaxID=210409 RepID=A0A5B7EMI8_PORTR|nr:hypothetical protein [Portunus trituberculatus]